jgi:TonB family protein
MKRLSVTLTVILYTMSLASSSSAQEPKTPPPTPSPSTANDQPKGEVDLAVENLKKHGEGVVTMVGEESTNSKDSIKGGVINGRAIELVQPTYPAIARSAHASGEVVVLVIIDKTGKVMAAQIVDGHPLLRVAAMKAAKASRFTPTQLEGKPVNILGKIVYNFVAMNP